MANYDSTWFDPPAPLGQVALRNTDTCLTWSGVPMLLDSGADISLVPQAAVTQLGLAVVPDRQYELVGFDGRTSFASIVQLELIFCGRTFRGQFLLINQGWGILGRNILNAVPL